MMKQHPTLKLLSLLLLMGSQEQAYSLSENPFRAHALWEDGIDECPFQVRNASFANGEFQFEQLPLTPRQVKRAKRFYKQCMSDGGMFCDHSNGSCERGTCGQNNKMCKPRMSERNKNVPEFGVQCTRYALKRVVKSSA